METRFDSNEKMTINVTSNVQVEIDFQRYNVREVDNGEVVREIDMRNSFSLTDLNNLLKEIQERIAV